MNIIKWVMQWFKRRRVRRELLAAPGVDLLVQRVMDARFGKHHWRVSRDPYGRISHDMLEAEVQILGQGTPWWGLIGPLHAENTRAWLRAGGKPPEVSHAKPYGAGDHFADTEPPDQEGWYDEPPDVDIEPLDVDTEPLDDDGRTEK